MNKRLYFLFTCALILCNYTLLFAYQINTLQVQGRLATDTLRVDTILSSNLNKKIVVLDTLLLAGLKSANAMDSIVMIDPITGELRRRNATQLGGGNSNNMYTADGTLTGNRTVTMSNNSLNFTGAKVGIGNADPWALLHFGNTFANRKLIFSQTINNEHQFSGLGVNSNILRYQVEAPTSSHIFYSGIDASSSKELLRITGNGNIGIGNANPFGPLHLDDAVANRKIILYQYFNGNHNFFGFGMGTDILRYHVDAFISSHIFYSGVDAASSKELMRIQGDGKVLIPSLIGTNTSASANATDSIVMVDPITGELRRGKNTNSNIYIADGTLTGNRTVIMANNSFNFTGGNIGLSRDNPFGPLHLQVVGRGAVNKGIILYQANNNNYQFYGFGLGSNDAVYTIEGPNASHVFYAGINATSSKELMRIQGDGKVLIPSLLGANITASAKATDSIVMVDPATGELRRRNIFQMGSIYTTDGTLIANRTVTMAGKNLNFTGGKIGIGNANPWGPLHFENTRVNRKLILYQTVNNEHDFYGFGVNSSVLRYQVGGSTGSHVFYAGINATSSKELMRIQGDGKIFIPTLLTSNYVARMYATDSVVTVDPTSGELRRRDALQLQGANIYTTDGTLTGNRTVTMINCINFTGGNIGIGNANPFGPLHFANTAANRKIILYQTANNEHQFSGFGIGADILRYQIGYSTSSHVFYSGIIDYSSSKELFRIQGDGKVLMSSLISTNTAASAKATDDIVTVDPVTGELRRGNISQLFSSGANIYSTTLTDNRNISTRSATIYTADGTLTANRTINMKGYTLLLGSGTGSRVGIGNARPFGSLHFANTVANRKIILYQTANNEHEFFGFGVGGNTLRYQVDGVSSSHVFYIGTNSTTSKELMRIRGDGLVGIGISNPEFPLHITDFSTKYRVTQGAGIQPGYMYKLTPNRDYSMPISIYASGAIMSATSIWSVQNASFSDKRIKKDITLSDSKLDLHILNKIKVSNYKLIDSLAQGQVTHKKVIAQELEQVYPQAVNTSTNYIPNVYQISEKIIYLSDTLALIAFNKPLDSECIMGRRIRFHNQEGKELSGFIKEVKAKSLVISQVPKNQKGIFVYGVEVNDFKSVDYDEVTMLNVSATQEVYKTVITQKNTIQQSETMIRNLKTNIQQRAKQIEEIFKLLEQ